MAKPTPHSSTPPFDQDNDAKQAKIQTRRSALPLPSVPPRPTLQRSKPATPRLSLRSSAPTATSVHRSPATEPPPSGVRVPPTRATPCLGKQTTISPPPFPTVRPSALPLNQCPSIPPPALSPRSVAPPLPQQTTTARNEPECIDVRGRNTNLQFEARQRATKQRETEKLAAEERLKRARASQQAASLKAAQRNATQQRAKQQKRTVAADKPETAPSEFKSTAQEQNKKIFEKIERKDIKSTPLPPSVAAPESVDNQSRPAFQGSIDRAANLKAAQKRASDARQLQQEAAHRRATDTKLGFRATRSTSPPPSRDWKTPLPSAPRTAPPPALKGITSRPPPLVAKESIENRPTQASKLGTPSTSLAQEERIERLNEQLKRQEISRLQLEAARDQLIEQVAEFQASLHQSLKKERALIQENVELTEHLTRVESSLAQARDISRGPDELTRLRGVGPKLAARLAEQEVTQLGHIKAWTGSDVQRISSKLKIPTHRLEEWQKEAKDIVD